MEAPPRNPGKRVVDQGPVLTKTGGPACTLIPSAVPMKLPRGDKKEIDPAPKGRGIKAAGKIPSWEMGRAGGKKSKMLPGEELVSRLGFSVDGEQGGC